MLQIKLKTKIWLLALGFLLPFIRFNSNTYIIKQQSYDQKYFSAYVQYFRGEQPNEAIKPATNWRFLLPLIASVLPFEPKSSLNIVNYLAFIFSVILIGFTLKIFSKNHHHIINALLVFVYSFPTLYYNCIGYADTLCLFFISCGIYAVLKHQIIFYFLFLILGFSAKENMVLIIPFAFGYFWAEKQKIKAVIVAVVSMLLVACLRWFIIKYAPVSSGYSNQVFWQINLQSIIININRFNTWFSSLITIIPVLIIFGLSYKNINQPLKLAIVLMAISAFFLWVFSFITTIADGRILWMTYPAFVLSALFLYKTKNNLH